MENQTIGEFILMLIKRKGITIQTLADELGVGRAFLSNIIHGRKQFPTDLVPRLKKYCDLDNKDSIRLDLLAYGKKKMHKVNLSKIPSCEKKALIKTIDTLVESKKIK